MGRQDGNTEKSRLELLERVIPFRFLSETERRGLLPEMELCAYGPDERIIAQGADDRFVYLLGGGSVVIQSPKEVDPRRDAPRIITTVNAGHYFGEWESVFDCPRTFEIVSLDHSWCYRIDGNVFLNLVRSSRAFAQGLGTLLRERQGIFAAFDRFKAQLLRDVTKGYLVVQRLLPLFQALEPALHRGASDPTTIDVTGLSYAVRRLPANITRTFALLLTDDLVGAYSDPDRFFPAVPTAARRREVWEMLPGKDLVLLRNGISDLVDFVTCLCTYATEAEKIRKRLSKAEYLSAIKEKMADNSEASRTEVLSRLPFSRAERDGLCDVWPNDTVARLFDIARHREMFGIDVRRGANTYNSRRAEVWAGQVAAASAGQTGYDPSCLPDDVEVHIISSNTHSVTNCLNPWYRRNRDRVSAWAHEHRNEIATEAWENEYDKVYALARDYFTELPDRGADAHVAADSAGISRLRSTASTGIQVQLIDCGKLSAAEIDPGIRNPPTDRKIYIVNIDYAFGEQAEHIMRNLLMLFGRNVASINFLGKAGALQGRRGDILEPTAFVEQAGDLFQPIPPQRDLPHTRLAARVPDRTVHRGPLLTVDGTLLQNRLMLNFYRHIWHCIGLEMEGTYYYRQVLESKELGVIRDTVDMRFFYYVSDLPLEHHDSLSSRLNLLEGVPPLYAITRHILDEVFTARS